MPTPKTTWEERFELHFDKPHSQMYHLRDKGKDCEICEESSKLNPHGYYKTYLTEQEFYWNDQMFQDVKQFIKSEISQAVKAERERVLKDMKQKMFHWHGTGHLMIDDYLKLPPPKE